MNSYRYAASQIVRVPAELEGQQVDQKIRGNIQAELGRYLVKQLEELGNQAAVKLKWIVQQANWEFEPTYRYILEAEVIPMVLMDVKEIRVLAEPTWGVLAHGQPQAEVQVEWQCVYCGHTNLVAEHLECRKCGAPRKPLR